MTDPAARIRYVAPVARNHVDVKMWHGLPGRFTRVETDVVALGCRDEQIEDHFDLADKCHQGVLLLHGGVKPSAHDALWDNKCVPKGNGEAVRNGECELVRGQPFTARALEERGCQRRGGQAATVPKWRSDRTE